VRDVLWQLETPAVSGCPPCGKGNRFLVRNGVCSCWCLSQGKTLALDPESGVNTHRVGVQQSANQGGQTGRSQALLWRGARLQDYVTQGSPTMDSG
jgi:hypothetical protein